MNLSDRQQRRAWLLAVYHAAMTLLLAVSLVLPLAFVAGPIVATLACAVLAIGIAVVSRLMLPRIRALIVLETAAVAGLDDRRAAEMKAEIWGRHGIAQSVLGLNRTMLVLAIIVMLTAAGAFAAFGDYLLAIVMLAIPLVAAVPLVAALASAGISTRHDVEVAVVRYARGEVGSLDEAAGLMWDRARKLHWPDPWPA